MNSEETYTDSEESAKEFFFFDSYAFFEILKANERYAKYKGAEIVTTKLNLFEIYFGILREKNGNEAKRILDLYYPFAVDFDKTVIEEAAKLKDKLNNRNVSMTDCIGYALAKQLGIKFLTGDKEFEGLDNVKFVK